MQEITIRMGFMTAQIKNPRPFSRGSESLLPCRLMRAYHIELMKFNL